MRNTKELKKTFISYLPIFILAFGFITVFSKCSPLYNFNNSPDEAVIFEVGKRMFSGDVLYRDVIDQKGPFLFFVYGIASLISKTSCIGLYLIEIICSFFSLVFAYKTITLKYSGTKAFLGLLFVASTVYCFPLNTYGGDTAELMMMPFLTYLYYVGFNYIYKQKQISYLNYLVIGITSGCILWTKYTMLGIYVAWFIIPAADMIKSKQIKKFINNCLMIILGVAISTAPWIIYFKANNFLKEFIDFYFFQQAAYYTKLSIEQSIAISLILITTNFAIIIFASIITLISYKKQQKAMPKRLIEYNLLIFVFLYIFIYIIGNGARIHYYLLEMFVLNIPGSMMLLYTFENAEKTFPIKNKKAFSKINKIIYVCLCVAVCITSSSTINYLGEKEESTPYYKFSQTVNSYNISNPKIYGNCIDAAPFFKYMNCFENYKYVSMLNCPFPDMIEHYQNEINNGDYDFIINVYSSNNYSNYTAIETVAYKYQGENITFTLYANNKYL